MMPRCKILFEVLNITIGIGNQEEYTRRCEEEVRNLKLIGYSELENIYTL